MTISILAFGIVKEIFGTRSLSLELPGELTVGMLMVLLKGKYPKLTELTSFTVAINGDYASPDTIVNKHDEIAIIPPVSGG